MQTTSQVSVIVGRVIIFVLVPVLVTVLAVSCDFTLVPPLRQIMLATHGNFISSLYIYSTKLIII